MKCYINSYNFSAFGDFSSIESTPENVYELMDLFREDKLIPSTFNEVVAVFNQTNIHELANVNQLPNNVIARPTLNSIDNKRSILLGSERLDFVVNNQTQYNGLKINTTTHNKCAEIFAGKIFKKYQIKSSRLALNTEFIIDDLSDDNRRAIINKFFNPIGFYKGIDFREWNQRIAVRKFIKLISNEEELNVIMNIRQSLIQTSNNLQKEFKKIIAINFDINTAQENMAKRFNETSIEPFIREATIINKDILEQIEGVIDEIQRH